MGASHGRAARRLAATGLLVLVAGGPASARAAGPETLRVVDGGTDATCATGCGTVDRAINRGTLDLQNGTATSVRIIVGPGRFPTVETILNGPMTIQGVGVGQTVLDGGGGGSVLSIATNATATVADLTITGGKLFSGGGVYNTGTL